MTGSTAKQAFDSIVQRDAPDANRGRTFARFETRFQLVWVIGALLPIIIPIPIVVGFALIALVAAVALIWYLIGLRQIRSGRLPSQPRGFRRRPQIDESELLIKEGFAPSEQTSLDSDGSVGGSPMTETSAWSASSGFAPQGSSSETGLDLPFDPARRWMRRSAPLPPRVARPASHRGDGLLFSAEAWDDPNPETQINDR
jgi:hypothetical protein